MFRGPHFIMSNMQAGTTPIFKVFGMTSQRTCMDEKITNNSGGPAAQGITWEKNIENPCKEKHKEF